MHASMHASSGLRPFVPPLLSPCPRPCSVNEEFFLYFGGCIGYWQGDVLKLLEDIAALKPAMFVGVPRVFDRIYSRVMGQVSSRPSAQEGKA